IALCVTHRNTVVTGVGSRRRRQTRVHLVWTIAHAQTAVGTEVGRSHDVHAIPLSTTEEAELGVSIVTAVIALLVQFQTHAIKGRTRNEVDYTRHRSGTVERRSTVCHHIDTLHRDLWQEGVHVGADYPHTVDQVQRGARTEAAQVDGCGCTGCSSEGVLGNC